MTPAELITVMERDGVGLQLTLSGRLKIAGDREQIDRWLGTVNQYQAQLTEALQAAATHPAARECAHPGCDRLTLRELCDRHRAPASADTEGERLTNEPEPAAPAVN